MARLKPGPNHPRASLTLHLQLSSKMCTQTPAGSGNLLGDRSLWPRSNAACCMWARGSSRGTSAPQHRGCFGLHKLWRKQPQALLCHQSCPSAPQPRPGGLHSTEKAEPLGERTQGTHCVLQPLCGVTAPVVRHCPGNAAPLGQACAHAAASPTPHCWPRAYRSRTEFSVSVSGWRR